MEIYAIYVRELLLQDDDTHSEYIVVFVCGYIVHNGRS